MTVADRAARILRLLEPERAHRWALRAAPLARQRAPAPERESVEVKALGLTFPNPIGLAAGFDKNAAACGAMLDLGFGFIEVGTVTPLPQEGNPTPRLFRLTGDRALINRLGFNNLGHEAVAENLDRRRRPGIVGVNLGANRDASDRTGDYVAGVRLFGPLASYLTVNISSPNTPGLRDLQSGRPLVELVLRLEEARLAATEECGRRAPMLLKIAPDMDDRALGELVEIALANQVDGLIIANTTTSRPELRSKRGRQEHGGLSGRPLFERSTAMLARARQLAGPDLVLVGVGGIEDAGSAWSKITAGADLLQLYTGLVYEGPSLPRRIVDGLVRRLAERNIGGLRGVRGIETTRWAAAWGQSA